MVSGAGSAAWRRCRAPERHAPPRTTAPAGRVKASPTTSYPDHRAHQPPAAGALEQLGVNRLAHAATVSVVKDVLPDTQVGLLADSRQWPLLAPPHRPHPRPRRHRSPRRAPGPPRRARSPRSRSGTRSTPRSAGPRNASRPRWRAAHADGIAGMCERFSLRHSRSSPLPFSGSPWLDPRRGR